MVFAILIFSIISNNRRAYYKLKDMYRRELPKKDEERDRPDTIIAPSILSSDFAQLASECARMVQLGADWLHVDIMDGHFVPNLTLGPPILKALRKHTDAFLDCHLMVTKPWDWIKPFAQAGADMFTFHLETVADKSTLGEQEDKVLELIKAIREEHMHVGIAIKPSTPAQHLLPYLEAIDLALVLTVEPGFGGQSFMEDKVKKCREIREKSSTVLIEVDGGLSPETVDQAASEGANVIVAGSAIFGAKDPQAVMASLRLSIDNAAHN